METIGKVSVTGLLNTGRDQIESIYGWIYVKLLKHSNHYNVKIIYYYYFSLFVYSSIPTACFSLNLFFLPHIKPWTCSLAFLVTPALADV